MIAGAVGMVIGFWLVVFGVGAVILNLFDRRK